MHSSPFQRNIADTVKEKLIGVFVFINIISATKDNYITTNALVDKMRPISSYVNTSSMSTLSSYDSFIFDENNYLADKITLNFEKLNDIAKLKNGWDGYKAKSFSDTLIAKVKQIIFDLPTQMQPDLFPTARNSIQLEYHMPDESYLEFEVFESKILAMQIPRTEYDNAHFEELACNNITRIKQIVDHFINA